MSAKTPTPTTHWILGSFKKAEQALSAIRALRKSGEKDLDLYSAYPVHGAEKALGLPHSKVPLIVACCALIGASTGYFIQTYTNATSFNGLAGEWLGSLRGYMINVGGRTLHAWPLNIPITFELGVLISAFGAVFGMLALNGLPRLHHPVFDLETFHLASMDKFFLIVFSNDRRFDPEGTRDFLMGLKPHRVDLLTQPAVEP